MAASDGEDRVIATAHHIVRSLGTTDTMTDDMLQILSKFDHRFSSMNEKKLPKKLESLGGTSDVADSQLLEGTVSQNVPQSSGDSSSGRNTLDSAEDVVLQWDMGYSENARQRMIWECPPEEAGSYLEAVDEVQNMLDSLSVSQSDAGLLERAQNLLQLAMARLEEEFRHMLVTYSESVDPDWLLDSLSARSFSRSNLEDVVNELSQSSGEEDDADNTRDDDGDDDVPVARPVGDLQPIVDLLPPEIVPDLADIAQRMLVAGYMRECFQVYASVRKSVLEESLYRLGVEKLSIGEVQKLSWEIQESKIKKWNQAMKVAVKVLFASEKGLCDQIFPAPFPDSCFAELAKAAMMQLLSFGEAIAISRRAPERLFKILDMYETLRDLLPEIDSIFCGEACASVREEAAGILMRLGEAARGTFAEFENAIQRYAVNTAMPGGAVHPLTRYVMNYIKFLCDYTDTLKQLFGEKKREVPRLLGDSNGGADFLGEDEGGRREELSPLALQTILIINVLQTNLEGKSKLYRDPALTYVFLMNNVHYMVQKVKCSELRTLLGDDWVRKHTTLVRQYANSYQRAAWVKVLSCLRDEGIHSSGGLSSGVSRVVLKDRFKNFNVAFEEVHKIQSSWIVFDPQLRDELRISITSRLLPAYVSFLGRYGHYLETGRHPEKYIKYAAEELEVQINDLFEGSSGSMTRRSFSSN